LTKLFAESHPTLSRSRFHTITNGVDGVGNLPDMAVWDGTRETIDIGYVGSFYWTPRKPATIKKLHRYLQYNPGTEDWSYRSPLPFFRAWAALDRLQPETGARLRFHHVGQTPEWLLPMAAEYGLADRCICHGLVPRQNVPVLMERMTGLLGTSMKRIGGNDYCLASKSFEYLASGKAVLAFVCPGAQRRFFKEVGGAVLLDPDDPNGGASEIHNLAGHRRTVPIHLDALQAYDLDCTAKQMATLLKRAVGQTNGKVDSDAL
jgi:glycosyltransferase involved in cell wall biosynthesis